MYTMRSIVIAALALMPALCSAQLKNAENNADIKKIEAANKEVSTIECGFVRTTTVAAVKSETKSEGTFYFSNPTNLSMKYADGETFVVTADNVSVTIGGKSRTLRSGNRHVEALSETLLHCVKGEVSAVEGTLSSAKTVGKNVVLKIATNMSMNRSKVKTIELAYDKNDGTLVSLNMIEADGSSTKYDLQEKKLNKPIDAKVFEHAKKKKK